MRTINKFFYLLAFAALAGLASCQTEEKFVPGEEENPNCEGVYFIKQDVIEESQIFDPTQEKVDTIYVRRSNSDGALTVTPKVGLSIVTSDGSQDVENDVFTVSDIKFEDGQVESYVAIDFSKVKEGVQYVLHLAIEGDEYTSKYSSALKAADYKVMCVAYVDFLNPETKKPAKVTFTSGWWNETHTAYIKYYEVDGIRHCITYDEELVGVPDVDGGADGFWGVSKDQHLSFLWYLEDMEECDAGDGPHPCQVPAGYDVPEGSYLLTTDGPQYIYTHSSLGDIYMHDNYWVSVNFNGYARPFLHYTEANDLFDVTSYYDGNGGFYFYSYYNVNSAGSGWKLDAFDLIGIAEGFTREDFSIELSAGLTQEDASGTNVVPIEFEIGPDVKKVGYTVLDGVPSGAQISAEVAAIAKDTVDYKYATFVDADGVSFVDSVSAKASGVYTVVAVAFDKDKKAKANATVEFNYLLTGETSKVILNVAAGSTAKYESRGYSPITSIEYTVSAVGATGVIPLLYTEKEVAGEGGIDAVLADIKADPNTYYAALEDYGLTETQLADVNDKGFSDILSGLAANTTYYVIVWATNGYDTAVAYATQTTDGLPNEVIKDGTGTFTYSLFFTDYDEATETEYPVDDNGLSLEFNPNTGLYEIPNWGNGVTFSFEVAEDKSISVPLQPTGYTSSSYGPVYVTDFSHLDELIGSGFCAYYGIDTEKKGYIDEDGYYHFFIAYAVSAGTFGRGEEIFYPDGKPAAAPTVAPLVLKNCLAKPVVSLQKRGNFFTPAGVKGLEPVSTSVKRVEAGHNITVGLSKKAGRYTTPEIFRNRI